MMALLLLLGAIGCASDAPKITHRDVLEADAQLVLQRMLNRDRSLALLLDSSAGYAVIPDRAAGRGIVYDCDGTFLGYSKNTPASAGQVADGCAVLVIFHSDADLSKFTAGQAVTFGSSASLTAAGDGAASQAGFTRGITVLTVQRDPATVDAPIEQRPLQFQSRADPDLLAAVPTQK